MFDILYYVCLMLLLSSGVLLLGFALFVKEKDWQNKGIRRVRKLFYVTILCSWIGIMIHKVVTHKQPKKELSVKTQK